MSLLAVFLPVLEDLLKLYIIVLQYPWFKKLKAESFCMVTVTFVINHWMIL